MSLPHADGAAARELWQDVLLDGAGLAQGVLDRAYAAEGADSASPLSRACGQLLRLSGDAMLHGAYARDALRDVLGCLSTLRELLQQATLWREPLTRKEPEGFAFYSVLPQQYALSARCLRQALASPERARATQVIGIRSAGTALSAVVAAELQSAYPIWTLRPGGHPFARTLRIASDLERALLEESSTKVYAIVDEGPGLSGSSFLAVVSWLVEHGVDPRQIWLLPSHPNPPGFAASPAAQTRYASLQRVTASFEELCLSPESPLPLHALFSDLVGQASAPLLDLSGGKWRAQFYASESKYPPCHVQQERRKYLLHTENGAFLLRFEGLGERGRNALARARRLHGAGFAPEMLAVRCGYSLNRWEPSARPLAEDFDRTTLIERVASYVGFVAQSFGGMPAQAGASPRALAEMTRHNVNELFGAQFAGRLCVLQEDLAEIEALHATTATDNRMERHRWLVLENGQLIKSDALQQHDAHDCIGCQDPTWDIVGAAFELDFTQNERAQFLEGLGCCHGLRPSKGQLAFYELSYLAFRAGYYALAHRELAASCPAEARRLQAVLERYQSALYQRLSTPGQP